MSIINGRRSQWQYRDTCSSMCIGGIPNVFSLAQQPFLSVSIQIIGCLLINLQPRLFCQPLARLLSITRHLAPFRIRIGQGSDNGLSAVVRAISGGLVACSSKVAWIHFPKTPVFTLLGGGKPSPIPGTRGGRRMTCNGEISKPGFSSSASFLSSQRMTITRLHLTQHWFF